MTNPLDSWVQELAAALGADPDAVDRTLLLDVARDAAHAVARPAAPLTTFLVGLAAGRAGGGAAEVRAAAQLAQQLATRARPVVETVNIGRPRPNPDKVGVEGTGIGKLPADGPVEVRDPGPKQGGLGSGLVGDFIGDTDNHGGSDQALYAFQREDLDAWQQRLGRALPNGFFGENLTTRGIDVNEARLGERWQIGAEVVVQVTAPRIPCSTFRGQVGESGWLKPFTEAARPGAYLRIVTPGAIAGGDPITVVHRPDHDITVALTYRATMTERELRPRLAEAGADLIDELRELLP